MKKKKKHEEKLSRTPFEGDIAVGDRVVFWMPASRKNSYPVGGEVNAVSADGTRIELRKLSVCNDPDVCMEIDRSWVALNKGQRPNRRPVPTKPYNVWITINGNPHDELPRGIGRGTK